MGSLVVSRVSITTSYIAKLMNLEREVVLFFPRIERLRDILKDYYCYGKSKEVVLAKLKMLEAEVNKDEEMSIYSEGIRNCIEKIEVT